MSAVTPCDDGLVLRLYIQPKASRDSIVGLHGDEVKVAITAPPVDGQANSHLVKFLGKQFRVAKSQLSSSYLSTCIHPGLIAFTVIGVFDKDITKLLVKETIPPFEAP